MNNSNRIKIKTKDILQSDLEHLYFIEGKSLDEIGHHYGFYDRQPIMRLFKKFGIKTRSKSENAKRSAAPIPDRDTVVAMITGKSVLSAAKEHNISRSVMTRYVKHYNLNPNYFVNKDIKNLILDSKFDNSSPKEISLELGIDNTVIKYYRKDFPETSYTRDEIINKIQKYDYDLDNQGLVKQIKYDDISLYNSIYELTKNHKLQSSKLTERLYRIINEYYYDQIDCCQHCGEALIFYTYKLGYGNSDSKICKNCLSKHCGFGVSIISQKLFDSIYDSLTNQEQNVCRYHHKGGEKVIYIDPDDRMSLTDHNKNLNKYKYHIDFIMDDKIIEFDGTYWHNDSAAEIAKDAFLKLKGYSVFHVKEEDYYENSNAILQQCLNFLRQ